MTRTKKHQADVLEVAKRIEIDLFVLEGIHDPSWLEVARAYYGRKTISSFELQNIYNLSDRVMDQLRQDSYTVCLVNQNYYNEFRNHPELILEAPDPKRPVEDQQRANARRCLCIGKIRYGLIDIESRDDPRYLIWEENRIHQNKNAEGWKLSNGRQVRTAVVNKIIDLEEGMSIIPPVNGHPLGGVEQEIRAIEDAADRPKAIETGKEG